MKILLGVLLLGVVASLFSGLYFIGADKGKTDRAVIALSVRIAFSIAVFGLLMAANYFGWLADGKLS